MSLTRRSLLRRGGATAAGAGVLGALSAAAPASAQLGDDRETWSVKTNLVGPRRQVGEAEPPVGVRSSAVPGVAAIVEDQDQCA